MAGMSTGVPAQMNGYHFNGMGSYCHGAPFNPFGYGLVHNFANIGYNAYSSLGMGLNVTQRMGMSPGMSMNSGMSPGMGMMCMGYPGQLGMPFMPNFY